MELEVFLDGSSIRLVRAVDGPKIVRVGKRLVARPSIPPEQRTKLDVAKAVDEERNGTWSASAAGGTRTHAAAMMAQELEGGSPWLLDREQLNYRHALQRPAPGAP